MKTITSLRKKIDACDREIVGLLAIRFSLVKTLSRMKKEKGMKMKDHVREHVVYSNVNKLECAKRISSAHMHRIYKQIIEAGIQEAETNLKRVKKSKSSLLTRH